MITHYRKIQIEGQLFPSPFGDGCFKYDLWSMEGGKNMKFPSPFGDGCFKSYTRQALSRKASKHGLRRRHPLRSVFVLNPSLQCLFDLLSVGASQIAYIFAKISFSYWIAYSSPRLYDPAFYQILVSVAPIPSAVLTPTPEKGARDRSNPISRLVMSLPVKRRRRLPENPLMFCPSTEKGRLSKR